MGIEPSLDNICPMNIEEFYLAIKHVDDPDTFEEARPQIYDIAYGIAQEKTLTSATRYYLKQFEKNGHKRWFVSFNISAWFFQISWLFFRRLYVVGVFYVLLVLALKLGLFSLESGSFSRSFAAQEMLTYIYVVCGIFVIILSVCLGLFGNSLYICNVRRRFYKGIRSPASWWSWLLGNLLPIIVVLGVVMLCGYSFTAALKFSLGI